jgi:hypothetical protein
MACCYDVAGPLGMSPKGNEDLISAGRGLGVDRRAAPLPRTAANVLKSRNLRAPAA